VVQQPGLSQAAARISSYQATLAGVLALDQLGEAALASAGHSIGQREKVLYNRNAAGVGGRTRQSGATTCRRHDGHRNIQTPFGWGQGAVTTQQGRRNRANGLLAGCAALEATYTIQPQARAASKACALAITRGPTCDDDSSPRTSGARPFSVSFHQVAQVTRRFGGWPCHCLQLPICDEHCKLKCVNHWGNSTSRCPSFEADSP
jgi:hypothetical protein